MMLSGRDRRGWLLAAIFVGAAVAYIVLAFAISADVRVSEHRFGDEHRDDVRQVRVYVETLGVDAINDAQRLHISVSPSPVLQGKRADAADRDLTVQLGFDDRVQDLPFRAQEPMNPTIVEADLQEGAITAYPFDRYSVSLHVTAHEAGGASIPVQVTVWDGVAGWVLDVAQSPSGAPEEPVLRFSLRRSLGLRLLVSAIYAEMTLIALASLTIGGVIFLGRRPPESTLTGALTGMIFSLPVLRYALPGSPPLGVRADLLVFFWAEFAVALSLLLFVATWARTRAKT